MAFCNFVNKHKCTILRITNCADDSDVRPKTWINLSAGTVAPGESGMEKGSRATPEQFILGTTRLFVTLIKIPSVLLLT